MNKLEILETFFETIEESTEWGFECEDRTYGYYIDGVVSMTNRLLEKVKDNLNLEKFDKY